MDKASLEATVKVQFPLPSAVVDPMDVLPANSSIVLFASAVPVSVGVESLVILSLLEVPLSEARARSGVGGTAGADASIVRFKALDAAD